MNRRNFLSSLIGGVAATAAVRTFPFRVYSFASEIYCPTRLSAFLEAELERLDTKIHEPLAAITWDRDMFMPERLVIPVRNLRLDPEFALQLQGKQEWNLA